MRERRTRVVRGLTAAAVSTFAAAFSHGAAAGTAPSVVALAVASVLAVTVCIALAGRVTVLRLALAVVLSQGGFHALFAALPSSSGAATMAGHHGMVSLATDASAHVHAGEDAAMWLAHAAAALVTVLVLHHGERVLLQFAITLLLPLRSVLASISPVLVASAPPAGPGWPPVRGVPTALLPSTASRRGPPLGAPAFS